MNTVDTPLPGVSASNTSNSSLEAESRWSVARLAEARWRPPWSSCWGPGPHEARPTSGPASLMLSPSSMSSLVSSLSLLLLLFADGGNVSVVAVADQMSPNIRNTLYVTSSNLPSHLPLQCTRFTFTIPQLCSVLPLAFSPDPGTLHDGPPIECTSTSALQLPPCRPI